MDFRWTEEELRFRQEIQGWLRANLPADWREQVTASAGEDDDTAAEEMWTFEKAFARKMGQHGYLAIGWPKEYGGLGWTPMQQLIFNEEMALHKAPRTFMGAGIYQVGGAIITHGTEEQKKRFLPPIARGEVLWATLFSEPNAGSDLASLQTRAEDMGDYFLVNGQKIWSSRAHKSQHGMLLARTDPNVPKHKGISCFLIDMDTPGIKMVPIINMNDIHSFNSVFFDNMRIPRDRLLGEKNRGWYVGASALNFERSSIRFHVPAQQYFEELVDFAKSAQGDGLDPLATNPAMRHKLADMAVQLETSRLLAYRVVWLQSRGRAPDYEASVGKLFTTELTQRLVEVAMELLGLYGQLDHGSKHALLHGKGQRLYRGQRAITIGAGTSEIQRTIIARRGLGLGQAQ